jgi:diguanylate cyclase (GGDEF)-like protein/PAS domain S-box-containing protein
MRAVAGSRRARDRARAPLSHRDRYRTLFADSPVGIGLADEQGCFVEVNQALLDLLGRTETEVIGRSSAEFTHPEDRPAHRGVEDRINDSATGVARIEKRYVRPSGEIRFGWVTVRHTVGPNGQTWTMAHVQDVTERALAEREIADSEANLAALAEVTRRIQRGEDVRSTIVQASRSASGAAYVSLAELDDGGQLRVSASTHAFFLNTVISLEAPSVTASVFHSGEGVFLSDPAEHPLIEPSLLALSGAASLYLLPVKSRSRCVAVMLVGWSERVETMRTRQARAVELLADEAGIALEQAALIAELESRAQSDSLTGLSNRRGWDASLTELMEASRRSGAPLTIALADLDHFKRYNDTFGHLAGDRVLRAFAAMARSAVRTGDALARWGGEEFAIALPNCDCSGAPVVLDRFHERTPESQTCSIGYATWDGRESATELMDRVDRNLYAAKAAGRNRSMTSLPS